MPYISEAERLQFDNILDQLPMITKKGQLEYCIFRIMVKYKNSHAPKYSELHDCTYAAIHCGDEFRRRFLDEREDSARLENGDVE
jgi:hypothetical protein